MSVEGKYTMTCPAIFTPPPDTANRQPRKSQNSLGLVRFDRLRTPVFKSNHRKSYVNVETEKDICYHAPGLETGEKVESKLVIDRFELDVHRECEESGMSTLLEDAEIKCEYVKETNIFEKTHLVTTECNSDSRSQSIECNKSHVHSKKSMAKVTFASGALLESIVSVRERSKSASSNETDTASESESSLPTDTASESESPMPTDTECLSESPILSDKAWLESEFIVHTSTQQEHYQRMTVESETSKVVHFLTKHVPIVIAEGDEVFAANGSAGSVILNGSSRTSQDILNAVPETELLDTSANKSKGQLATSGALANRRPPTKSGPPSVSSKFTYL